MFPRKNNQKLVGIPQVIPTQKMMPTKPITLANPGEQGVHELNKITQHLMPVNDESTAQKFSGLKRYLKRSI